uniref:Uncharacterized protein n=1 Tax=uncultured Desulfobacterium sp. TaxID=201089 RepID=E1YGC4_9BACT|nr:unknown protein [uncultured Desulfobacterium sp.]
MNYKAKLFIHTSCLKQIDNFGLEVFHKNISGINVRPDSCWFTGEKATELIPERNPFLFAANV